jgi:hypothetical protein
MIGGAVAAASWGVQFGHFDNNICLSGPCISPLRLCLGAALAFAALVVLARRDQY